LIIFQEQALNGALQGKKIRRRQTMNREILFRGKRVDNGEFIEGCYFKRWTGARYKHYIIDWLIEYEVIPETVGQFTGLHDKNGNEIYEGDIIQLVDDSGETIIVVCEFGTARREIYGNVVDIIGFYFKRLCDGKKTFPIVCNYAGKHDTEIFEIVGNIYENPELLTA
jgi:uncharacterized phage protein (TIGR01671 family)